MLAYINKITYICNKITKQDNKTTKKSYPQLKKVLVYMNKITYLCNNNRHNVLNTTNGDMVMRHGRLNTEVNTGNFLIVAVCMYIIITYILYMFY